MCHASKWAMPNVDFDARLTIATHDFCRLWFVSFCLFLLFLLLSLLLSLHCLFIFVVFVVVVVVVVIVGLSFTRDVLGLSDR